MPDNAVREVIFNAETFKIIRQPTLQLPDAAVECPERLSDVDWNPEIGEFLYQLARSLPYEIAPSNLVTVTVTDADIDETTELNKRLAYAGEDQSPADRVRHAPRGVVNIWPTILRVTYDNFGPKEAWYRIGFREDEVNEALASFEAYL